MIENYGTNDNGQVTTAEILTSPAEATTQADRAAVLRAIAHSWGVPDEISFGRSGTLTLVFSDHDLLEHWSAYADDVWVLACRQPSRDGERLVCHHSGKWLGWHVEMFNHEPVFEETEADKTFRPQLDCCEDCGDKRTEEILDALNGFVDRECETESNIVDGRAVHSRVVVGSDYNLDKAIAWADAQHDDVDSTFGPLDGEAEVVLTDGTELVWVPEEEQWSVAVSDELAEVSA